MTGFDDDDLAAVEALRSGALGAMPTPSEELTAWFDSPPRPAPGMAPVPSRVRRLGTWLAGLGLGAHLALGAGVAVASVGIAGTADVLPGPVQKAFNDTVGRGGDHSQGPDLPDQTPTAPVSTPSIPTPSPTAPQTPAPAGGPTSAPDGSGDVPTGGSTQHPSSTASQPTEEPDEGSAGPGAPDGGDQSTDPNGDGGGSGQDDPSEAPSTGSDDPSEDTQPTSDPDGEDDGGGSDSDGDPDPDSGGDSSGDGIDPVPVDGQE